jgi:hypothetical protein
MYLFQCNAVMEQTRFMKHFFPISFIFFILGCSDEPVSSTANNTVHLAGILDNSCDGGVVSYWKDGVHTALVGQDTCSLISSLYVDGKTVFIGGSRYTTTSPSEAVVWKDGVGTVLDEVFGRPLIISRNNNLFGVWLDIGFAKWVVHNSGTSQPIVDTANDIFPTGLALIGDDVYVSGSSWYHDGSPNSPSYSHTQCWKDGQLIFRESELSNAGSIFIHQNDIYMAGYVGAWPNVAACYWKNGNRINLADNATATSIFVTDKHVYVSGTINDQAVYWKDDEVIALTTAGTSSRANSIFVNGEDVHVAGHQNGHPAYWKNNVKQVIANEDKFGRIEFVVVGSN